MSTLNVICFSTNNKQAQMLADHVPNNDIYLT